MNQYIEKAEIRKYRQSASHNVTQKLKENGTHSCDIHSICLVLPFHNEEENLFDLVKRINEKFNPLSFSLSFFLVDDCSSDQSLAVARELTRQYVNVSYISFSKNFGKEAAVMAGLRECGDGFDAVAYMDSDGQHTVDDLLRLIEAVQDVDVDLVCGVRSNRDYQNLFQKNMALVFYYLFSKISKTPIDKGAGDFNVLKMPVVHAIRQMTEPNVFMKGIIGWLGFRKRNVEIYIEPRAGGVKKSSTINMLRLAFGAILSFSSWPLRVWSGVGLFFALFSLAYLFFVIGKTVLYGETVPGYATIVVLVLGLGGVQLLSIGIIGEYIARIYDSSKNRPLYIIAEKGIN